MPDSAVLRPIKQRRLSPGSLPFLALTLTFAFFEPTLWRRVHTDGSSS